MTAHTQSRAQPKPTLRELLAENGRLVVEIMGLLFNLFFSVDRRARGLLLLAVVTIAYLSVEFAFGAWLLDIMATNSTAEEISKTEHTGRLLSGFAVALMIWPIFLKKDESWALTTLKIAAITGLVMTVVYHSEKKYINDLVRDSSSESRAQAATGMLLRQGLLTGSVSDSMFNGLLDKETSSTIAGKAFVGVISYMSAQSESARAQTLSAAPQIVSDTISSRLGGVGGEYDRFLQSQAEVTKEFGHYQEGVLRYKAEIAKSGDRAEEGWIDYLNQLEKKNKKWGRNYKGTAGELAPAYARYEIRNRLRARDMNVPKDWRTGDKATFIRLHKEQQVKVIRQRVLQGIPDNLTIATFAAQPTVQSKWKDALRYPNSALVLSLAPISKAEFDSKIFQPMLKTRTSSQLSMYQSTSKSFGKGGIHEEKGKRAFEAMIAPVFALTLSLTGALAHIVKVALLLIQIITGVRFRSSIVKGAFIAGCITYAFMFASSSIATKLTQHETYRQWTAVIEDSSSTDRAIMFSLDAMIKIQTISYPIFSVFLSTLEAASSLFDGKDHKEADGE